MFGCIYLITNKVNGKRYVGQTVSPIAKRWAEHKCMAGKGVNTALLKIKAKNRPPPSLETRAKISAGVFASCLRRELAQAMGLTERLVG